MNHTGDTVSDTRKFGDVFDWKYGEFKAHCCNASVRVRQ